MTRRRQLLKAGALGATASFTNGDILKKTILMALAAMLAVATTAGHAQANYPSKTITIKVPFPAGGSTDAGIRRIQPQLQAKLGEAVVIENISGVGGAIGVQNALRFPPDGHTVVGHSGSDMILAPLANSTAKYDPTDFKLIAPILHSDFVLVASNNQKYQGLEQFLKHVRTKEKRAISIAHWGQGSTSHIVGVDFQSRAGVQFLEIPYKGVSPIIPDLISGVVDLTFLPLGGPTFDLIKTGKIQAIALTGNKRNPFLPEVEAISEHQEFRGFSHMAWSGFFVRRETPDAVSEKFAAASRVATSSPEFADFAKGQASRVFEPMSTAEAQKFYDQELKKLRGITEALLHKSAIGQGIPNPK